jgi:hypothetical protein
MKLMMGTRVDWAKTANEIRLSIMTQKTSPTRIAVRQSLLSSHDSVSELGILGALIK